MLTDSVDIGPCRASIRDAAVDEQHRPGDALRAVLAGLEFPAQLWQLVAQAHAWGAGPAVTDDLNRLPDGTYLSLAEVLRALGHPPRSPASAGTPTAAGVSAGVTHAPKAGATGPNRTAQHKIVGEGLAVGLLALGVEAVTINGPVVEAAFRRAWSGWAQHDRFPQVYADAGRSDILAILQSSGRRKGRRIAEWACTGEYRPLLRVAGPLEQAGRRVGRPARVTHSQWLDLARALAGHLDRDAGEIRYRSGRGDPAG